MRLILSSLLLLMHAASTIAAEVPDVVKTCAEQNMPKTTASQAIELTAVNVDRVVDGRIVEHGGAANLLEPLLEIGAIRVVGPTEDQG